jgi:hypothetical protein
MERRNSFIPQDQGIFKPYMIKSGHEELVDRNGCLACPSCGGRAI